jgi:hypothetical protein
MARRNDVPEKPVRKRNRRSEEQLISDLQAEIERIKKRAQAKKAKRSPSLKATADAVRSIDTALRTAENAALKKALTEAREPLVAYLQMEGVPLPQRRGRKPKRETVDAA